MISVVIPTRDRPESLSRCLDRLAPGEQTLVRAEYEVIVTDDSDRNDTEERVRRDYPWVQWVPGPRKGPGANRNSGVRQARGDWLAFTDDDCVPSHEWLAAFTGAIHDRAKVYEGRTTCDQGISSPLEEAPINQKGGLLWSCNFFIEINLFHQLQFDECFPFPYMEDNDFHERLAGCGHVVAFTPNALVDHPPRRRRLGFAAGRYWESRVYFHYKHGLGALTPTWLMLHILRVRLADAAHCKVSSDTAVAIGSALLEAGYVFTHVAGWNRKFKATPRWRPH